MWKLCISGHSHRTLPRFGCMILGWLKLVHALSLARDQYMHRQSGHLSHPLCQTSFRTTSILDPFCKVWLNCRQIHFHFGFLPTLPAMCLKGFGEMNSSSATNLTPGSMWRWLPFFWTWVNWLPTASGMCGKPHWMRTFSDKCWSHQTFAPAGSHQITCHHSLRPIWGNWPDHTSEFCRLDCWQSYSSRHSSPAFGFYAAANQEVTTAFFTNNHEWSFSCHPISGQPDICCHYAGVLGQRNQPRIVGKIGTSGCLQSQSSRVQAHSFHGSVSNANFPRHFGRQCSPRSTFSIEYFHQC